MPSGSSSDDVVVRLAPRVGRTASVRPGYQGHSDPRFGDAGMVTAELAMAIPSLVLVSSLLLSVIGTASDLSRAADAARSAARAASIGTEADEVVARALHVAPAHSSVTVRVVDGWAKVSVSVPPRHWGPLPLPAPPVTAEAPLDVGVAP